MVITHNLLSMYGNRSLGIVSKRKDNAVEKLSSGYRINRAADDAAGLKISEKMRGQIRGLNRASMNAQEGISLVQTADGALSEVQSLLQRARELSVQAANDTNVDADRQAIQDEIDNLIQEIDGISERTEFNTKKLLDGSCTVTSPIEKAITQPLNGTLSIFWEDEVTYDDAETVSYEFATMQRPSEETSGVGTYTVLADTLDKSIVPQAVNALINTYPNAFGYLSSCSTGIGLKIEGNSSSVLASVTVGTSNGRVENGQVTYDLRFSLSVNPDYLDFNPDGTLTADSRTEFEGTILHEMTHALMDEAMTYGMMSSTNKYPLWFVEGMAQTAVGGYANYNDWVNNALNINTSSTEENIKTVLSGPASLKSTYSISSYGTGYLAVMYLGYLAGGETLSASSIRNGVDKILTDLKDGISLSDIINNVTLGTYANTTAFENAFPDTKAATFVKQLTAAVGEGNGSLVGNDFSKTDLLPDGNATSTVLDLDTTARFVYNRYPDGVYVMSGGGRDAYGVAPDGAVPAGGAGGGGVGSVTSNGLNLQIGANSSQSMTISIDMINSMSLNVSSVSVMSHTDASDAITTFNDALETVSTTRAKLGAFQNRLEHVVSNDDNTSENMQASESRIRDMDMIQGTVDFSKENILEQVAQAMLAQSNQSANSVVSLLEG